MSKGTPYISPEYNPHALQRDWGFLVSAVRHELFEVMHTSLGTFRAMLCGSVLQHAAEDSKVSGAMPGYPAKVTSEGIAQEGKQLYREVGLDIMTLALLADVPAHRPLHLTQHSLIGHWRWLRDVWRETQSRPKYDATAFQTRDAVSDALQNGKNNLAVAELRKMFKEVQHAPENDGLYFSFLNSLSLFCPFIGTELLWRQGRIDHDPLGRSGTKDKEGLIE
ncbi:MULTISPECIES: hypothetical protein [unclassified Thalassospira]|uniref:hypothetical protein n=1 Tax=unclassified Thalassospira TaxID=2648997 RepID=UPI0025FAFC04|nr:MULTISPECIES: hypothetical protein [unclassified Thalassospira]|tara:strand:- start:2852 stop:3517 length:666 start_codon:yes stop_codon:yes gene_type:complete